jgi:hypothetical protein
MNKLRKLINREVRFARNPAANASMICRLKGNVNEKKIYEAIQKILIKHPLTACTIRIENDGFWLIQNQIDKLELRIETRENDNSWKSVFTEEHKKAFNITTGPLLRFCLIKGKKFSELIGICQHSICDGTGLAYLMADILAFTENPGIEAAPLLSPPPLTPEYIKKKYKESKVKKIIRKVIINMMNKKWQKQKIDFNQRDTEIISEILWSKYSYKIVTMEWEKERLGKLVEKCHNMKVSINSALTAAFIGAYENIFGAFSVKKKSVSVPVDLRNRIDPPAGNVLDFYVGGVMLKFSYDHNKSMWENARKFNTVMKKYVKDLNLFKSFFETEGIDPFLLDSVSFALYGKDADPSDPQHEKLIKFLGDNKNIAVQFFKKFLNFIPGTVMTNLARLKVKKNFNAFELDRMIFAPSSSPYVNLALAAITVSDCLVVTLNYAEPEGRTILTEKMTTVKNIAEKMLEN